MSTERRPPWDLWIDYQTKEPSGLTPTLLRYALGLTRFAGQPDYAASAAFWWWILAS
jgi:hypothetical protein